MWFSDERMVPPDHPDSNFAMASRALLSRLSQPPTVVRMQGELGADAAAGAYEALLRERMGSDPRFDLILLGMGPDSHTASLFPGKPELEETGRFAAPVPLAGMEPQVPRVTLTFPVLNGAREVDFLVAGADKADAVARAFAEPPDPDAPAARVRPTAGSLFVFLDEAAAAKLVEWQRRQFIGLDVGGTKIASATLEERQAQDARAGQDRRLGLRQARRASSSS